MANIKLEKAVERLITGDELNTKQINKKVTRVKTDGSVFEAGKQYMLDGDKDSFIEYVAPSTGGHITEITTGKVKDHLNEIFSALESGGEAVLSLKTPSSDVATIADSPLHYTNYQKLDLKSKLTTTSGSWFGGLTISGTKAFFANRNRDKWMKADYNPATGVFTNFQPLNLPPTLTIDLWFGGLKIEGKKAFFCNSNRNKWMTADYDQVAGTFSNFQPLDLTSKLTTASSEWAGVVISGTKAVFPNGSSNKWMKADYDQVAGTFSNFQVLNLSSKLSTSSSDWYGLVISGTKAVFCNYNSNKWMISDYDPATGIFTNFQVTDLSSKLTTRSDYWFGGLTISGTKAFFASGDADKWMSADAASIVHKDGVHYDIELMPYKKALTLHAVGDDILGDITKNKDYIEQDLGDGVTSGGNPKLIIKH